MPRKKKEEPKEPKDVEKILSKRDETTEKKRKRASNKSEAKSAKKMSKKEQQIMEFANNTVLPDHYFTVWTEADLDELCNWLREQRAVAVDTETMGVKAFIHDIVGISFYAPHRGYYIPLKHVEDIGSAEPQGQIGVDYVKCLPKEFVASKLKPILEDRSKKFLLHNAKVLGVVKPLSIGGAYGQ